MRKTCSGCFVTIATHEPVISITDQDNKVKYYHKKQGCFFYILKALHEHLQTYINQYKTGTLGIRIPDNFTDLDQVKETIQTLIDKINKSAWITDKIKLIAPLYLLAYSIGGFHPEIPDDQAEPVKQLIQSTIEAAEKNPLYKFHPINIFAEPPPPPPPALKPITLPAATITPPPRIDEPTPAARNPIGDSCPTDLTKALQAFNQMRTDALAIAEAPIRFEVDRSIETACTDCLSVIYFNPQPFEEGNNILGFGTGYHEAGHIRHSRRLHDILASPEIADDQIISTIINLIMDRHDDWHTAQAAPGFARTLRRRLGFLFPRRIIKDVWEDFFLACKKHTRPRTPAAKRSIRILRRMHAANQWDKPAIIKAARKIKEILSHHQPSYMLQQQQQNFINLYLQLKGREKGYTLNTSQKSKFSQHLRNILHQTRQVELKRLQKFMRNTAGGFCSVPPYPTNLDRIVITKLNHSSPYYQHYFDHVKAYIDPFLRALQRIDSPVETNLPFQEKGDLDLNNLTSLVTGFNDCFCQTTLETDIDLEVHLCIDQSGSMSGSKIRYAIMLATLFNAGIVRKRELIDGYIWGYRGACDTAEIFQYGQCRSHHPVAEAKADIANADHEMLQVVCQAMRCSRRRRKVVFMVGDDGPSDPTKVKNLSSKMAAKGIPVIHIMVGVHAAPRIYSFELLFDNFPELIKSFSQIFSAVLK